MKVILQDFCQVLECEDYEVCVNSQGKEHCVCPIGYYGKHCIYSH